MGLMIRYIFAILIAFRLLPAADTARIDAVLAAYDKPDMPGCVLAIMQDGRVIHERASGLANLEYRIPLTRHSVFEIASASKTFTALAVLLLEQDGKLSLNDPVTKYIPGLPDYARTITIRHLLGHTSGLRDAAILLMLAGRTYDDTTEWPELLALISRQKELNFQPGQDAMYSNTGYLLAAQIVRKSSGRTLRQFADEHIFGPLGMKDTHYIDNRWELIPGRASGYSPEEHGRFSNNNSGAVDMTGAAGVHTTLEDLERWETVFFDAKSNLAPLIARMQQAATLDDGQPAAPKDIPIEFGLGLWREQWGKRTIVEQSGIWGGYRSGIYRIPDERFSAICLCNRSDPDPERLTRQVAEIFYPDVREEPHAPSKPSDAAKTPEPVIGTKELKRLEGSYRCDELNATYHLTVRDGKLHAEVGHIDLTLSPESKTRFRGGPLVLTTTKAGLQIDVDNPLFAIHNLHLTRVP
jgi:CubicO group peptidase (beta-lactamase class C family)